jgi:hypothetical protein
MKMDKENNNNNNRIPQLHHWHEFADRYSFEDNV